MRLKRIGFLPALLVLVVMAAGMGCTGTDPLKTGTVSTDIEFEIVNNNTRFEVIRFTARALLVRAFPAGGPEDTANGGNVINLLAFNGPVTLATPLSETYPLADGAYSIKRLDMNAVVIEDTNPPAAFPGITCEEFIPRYAPTSGTLAQILLQDTQFGNTVRIIDADATTPASIRVIIDADAFVAAFQSSMGCTSSCSNGDPWCLVPTPPVDFETFFPQVTNFLTIQ